MGQEIQFLPAFCMAQTKRFHLFAPFNGQRYRTRKSFMVLVATGITMNISSSTSKTLQTIG